MSFRERLVWYIAPALLVIGALTACAPGALASILGAAAPVVAGVANVVTAEQRAAAARLAPGLPADDVAYRDIALRVATLERAASACSGAVAPAPTGDVVTALRDLETASKLLAGEVRAARERAATGADAGTEGAHGL